MITNYLAKNIRWQFNQDPFSALVCCPTDFEKLCFQLEKIANKYYPERKGIDTLYTEFCLNKIALSAAKTTEQKIVKEYFGDVWSKFCRLKALFGQSFLTFPSSGETRLEQIARLVTQCTQNAADGAAMQEITDKICETVNLGERETRYLKDALELYEINYYCALAFGVFRSSPNAIRSFAKAYSPRQHKFSFSKNDCYKQSRYYSRELVSAVDCMGNSAVLFDKELTKIDQKVFVYSNGRNVFDTFCNSRFGVNSAEFYSVGKTADTFCRYFVDGCSEKRNFKIVNKGKRKNNFVADVTFNCDAAGKTSYFQMDEALCLTNENENVFVATAVVCENRVIACAENNRLSFKFSLPQNGVKKFSVVTIYAHDTPTLADEISKLNNYGSVNCPFMFDNISPETKIGNIRLNLTPNGYERRKPSPSAADVLNFTYRLGDADEATFLDNAGNCATLLDGFPFGVKGESVYAVRSGTVTKLNTGKFRLDADKLRYVKQQGECVISHANGKTFEISYSSPSKTLFYFPLEQLSKITYENNAFSVSDGVRSYTVCFSGNVESYTANALECSEEKIRYKLSDDLSSGTCLAVCVSGKDVKAVICNGKKTPLPKPIVRESLVSTYLNYVNEKNVFCLKNGLKRLDSLTVSAICYTNPQFVKEYVIKNYPQNETFFYDSKGKKKNCCDKLALPLACVYYQSLAGDDLPAETKNYVRGVMFGEEFFGKDLCVKALLLKRAAQLNGYDKVKCLVEYNLLKKKITADSKLYAYAQAIGAVNMVNPSKERLKDLCNRYEIPKSWYYVSQLENLYGLSIADGKLNVCPKVSAENVLEQIALHFGDRKIDASFLKSTVRSMTLNGVQCFQPFCPDALKTKENVLEVRY